MFVMPCKTVFAESIQVALHSKLFLSKTHVNLQNILRRKRLQHVRQRSIEMLRSN